MSGGGAPEVKISEQERALAGNAAERYNEYQQNFVPLENSFIAQLSPTKGESDLQRGIATSDVAQSFKGLDAKVVAGSKGQGSQGKSIIARAGLSRSQGDARGKAAAGVDKGLRDRELGGLSKMSAFGRGLQDMNSVTLRNAAKNSAATALNDAQVEASNNSSLGTLLGAAAGTYFGQKGNVDILKEKAGKVFSFGGPRKLNN